MTRHEVLLQQYARELAGAKTRAEAWWLERSRNIRAEAGSKKAADQILKDRWPDGPASHPWVLAVIRKYWLACQDLNEQIEREDHSEAEGEEEYVLAPEDEDEDEDEAPEEEQQVDPHVFVLEWLMTDELDDLATFLGSLSYWPIGLDQEDRYT